MHTAEMPSDDHTCTDVYNDISSAHFESSFDYVSKVLNEVEYERDKFW